MTDTIKISRELLERLYEASGRGDGMHTDDLRAVRALLATPPADAADMGGQAGEEVETTHPEATIAWLDIGAAGCGGMSFAVPMQDILSMPWGRHALAVVGSYGIEGYKPSVEFLPVAQHRQQAGKLGEALREIHFRADCFVEDDMDMRVPSIEAIVRIAGEALADWEKTSCGK